MKNISEFLEENQDKYRISLQKELSYNNLDTNLYSSIANMCNDLSNNLCSNIDWEIKLDLNLK